MMYYYLTSYREYIVKCSYIILITVWIKNAVFPIDLFDS